MPWPVLFEEKTTEEGAGANVNAFGLNRLTRDELGVVRGLLAGRRPKAGGSREECLF